MFNLNQSLFVAGFAPFNDTEAVCVAAIGFVKLAGLSHTKDHP
jgi:hypothetical protein